MAEEEPSEAMLQFRIVRMTGGSAGARLGQLSRKNRGVIDTPHYIPVTSRGVVPHLSQDMLRKHTDVKGAYVALEDCKL